MKQQQFNFNYNFPQFFFQPFSWEMKKIELKITKLFNSKIYQLLSRNERQEQLLGLSMAYGEMNPPHEWG